MAAIIDNYFIQAVLRGDSSFNEAPEEKLSVVEWVEKFLSNHCSREELNQEAKEILGRKEIHVFQYDSKRYQFGGLDPADLLIKQIFKNSFYLESDKLINSAEKVQGSIYPLWKRVILIEAPKTISDITDLWFNNFFMKGCIGCFCGYVVRDLGAQGIQAIDHFLATKIVPFIINNLPIEVIEVFNVFLKAKDIVFFICDMVTLLLLTYLILQALSEIFPEIPYLTKALQYFHFIKIVDILEYAPVSVFDFLYGIALSCYYLIIKLTRNVSDFFNNIAEEFDEERVLICYKKTQELWCSLMSIKGAHIS